MRIAALLPLLFAVGPYLIVEIAGFRQALSALTSGEIEHLVPALLLLASWVWAVLSTVPATAVLFVCLLPARRPPHKTTVSPRLSDRTDPNGPADGLQTR